MIEKPDAEAFIIEAISEWAKLGGKPADLLAAMESFIADVWAEVQSK
ncbi:hypothetical protein [uncultured Sulfitobacter sp.]|nr:hypothetical protein [uncultured Sulfitobacter sp.]